MLIEQGGADIVRTRKTLLVMAACLGLLAAACGDDDDDSSGATTTAASGATTTAAAGATTTAASDTTAAPETTAAGGATTLPSRGDADLVLWLDETRATALKPIVDKFAEEQGVTTQIVEVAGDQLRDAVAQTAPQGTGPDLFAGAHDWLGEFVESGILAPIDLGSLRPRTTTRRPSRRSRSRASSTALPYAVENIALFRNTDARAGGAGLVRGARADGPRAEDRRHGRRAAGGAAGPSRSVPQLPDVRRHRRLRVRRQPRRHATTRRTSGWPHRAGIAAAENFGEVGQGRASSRATCRSTS